MNSSRFDLSTLLAGAQAAAGFFGGQAADEYAEEDAKRKRRQEQMALQDQAVQAWLATQPLKPYELDLNLASNVAKSDLENEYIKRLRQVQGESAKTSGDALKLRAQQNPQIAAHEQTVAGQLKSTAAGPQSHYANFVGSSKGVPQEWLAASTQAAQDVESQLNPAIEYAARASSETERDRLDDAYGRTIAGAVELGRGRNVALDRDRDIASNFLNMEDTRARYSLGQQANKLDRLTGAFGAAAIPGADPSKMNKWNNISNIISGAGDIYNAFR